MKNYVVKVVSEFNDYGEKGYDGSDRYIYRKKEDIFNCSKERFIFLRDNGVVILMGILCKDNKTELL